MRSHTSISLIAILLLALVAGWLASPSNWLDIGGIKKSVNINEGLDLQGGVQLLLEADPPAGTKIDSDAMSGVRDTIEKRVNGLGVSEPVVQTRGNNQVVVELAGATDPEEATRIVQKTALLEIIDTNGQYLPPGTVVTTTLGGPESVDTNAPAASPEASPLGSPQASPVGSPEASPIASPVAAPSPNRQPNLGHGLYDHRERWRFEGRLRYPGVGWRDRGRIRAQGRGVQQVLRLHQHAHRPAHGDRRRQDRHLIAANQCGDLQLWSDHRRLSPGSARPRHSAQGRRAQRSAQGRTEPDCWTDAGSGLD